MNRKKRILTSVVISLVFHVMFLIIAFHLLVTGFTHTAHETGSLIHVKVIDSKEFSSSLGDIQKNGVYVFPFWWAMLFAGTMYGNATVVGSTANIVAMGMMEKEYKEVISFKQWLIPGVIVSSATLGIAMTLLLLQRSLMP